MGWLSRVLRGGESRSRHRCWCRRAGSCRKSASRSSIGNNDYRNVPKLQKAVNDARTMGDTLKQLGFTVMVAENQNRQAFSQSAAGVRQGGRGRATPRSSSMPATALKSPARISCCRPTCRRRPKARKSWCATPRSSPTASSSGCRTRRCAHRHPGVRRLPQQSVRARRHPRGRRRRRACADDAIAGRRVLGVLGRSPADRARSALQRRRQSEFGVHAHLRQAS
mgnify:CR=1 FL=1